MIQPLVFKAGMDAQNNFPLHKHGITLNTAQFRKTLAIKGASDCGPDREP